MDIQTITQLADYFKDRVGVTFGWGTTLTNDLGLRANNFVMKATTADNASTVKLSDVAGKHTGPVEEIDKYKRHVDMAISRQAMRQLVAV